MLAPLLALALAALLCGCAPLPQIIVLEDPLTAEEHVALGVAHERRGELEPAAREYERALKQDGDSFRARLNLGNVRLAGRQCEQARANYLEALAVQPADPEATNNLAWAAICAGDGLEEALARLDAVLAAREGADAAPAGLTPALLDTRGVLLGRLGRRAEAEAALAQAEAACLAAGTEAATVKTADLAAPPPCPETVLSEIRAHRADLHVPPSP
jgi:tetratricopeptide (TPR) repeat protein